MRRGWVLVLGMSLACARGALAQGDVEAPIYRSWANFPVGTKVVIESRTRIGEREVRVHRIQELIELGAERAVVQETAVDPVTGQLVAGEEQELVLRRRFPLLPGVKAEDIGKPSNTVAQGRETLTVGGREYAATWYESKGNTEAGESIARTWISDEAPGRVLKSTTRVPKVEKEIVEELVEVKRPTPGE